MNYTGIRDINGNRIYKGDVVRFVNLWGKEQVSVVKFKKGCFKVFNGNIWDELYRYKVEIIERKKNGQTKCKD